MNFKSLLSDSLEATPYGATQLEALSTQETSTILDSYASTGQQDDDDDTGIIEDVATGFAAGVEGFGRSLIGLADMVFADSIPDEYSQNRFIERPTGAVGSVVEGLTQFGLGLIPGLGVAGLAGKAAKAASLIKATDKALLTAKTVKNLKGAVTGISADFVAFQGSEEKLSDLLKDTPYDNLVTQYLQTDQDDSEFEGRLKNVAEGGIVGGALTGVIKGTSKLVRAMRNYNGTDKAKEAIKEAETELTQTYIDNGTYTVSGLEQHQSILNIIDNTDPDRIDIDFKDTLEPVTKPIEPVTKPIEPLEAATTRSDEAVKPETSSVDQGLDDGPLLIGDETINSSERVLEALGAAVSTKEIKEVTDKLTAELMLRQVKQTPEEMTAAMIQQLQMSGVSPEGILDWVKKGGIKRMGNDDQTLRAIRFKQQGAFYGQKIALEKIGSISKRLTKLSDEGLENSDEYLTEIGKLEDAQIQHKHFAIIQSQIGSAAGGILGDRRSGVISKTMDFLQGKLKIDEELLDEDNHRRGARNNRNMVEDDKDTKDLFDAEDGTTKSTSDIEDAVGRKEKTLAKLKKQLEDARKKFTEAEIPQEDGTIKKVIADEDPEILDLKERIDYYSGAVTQEKSILKLRKELDDFSKASDQDLLKEEAKVERLKALKDMGTQEPEYKRVRALLRKIKAQRLKGLKATSKEKATVKSKVAQLNEQIEKLRKQALSGESPESAASTAKADVDPEIIKLKEIKRFYEKALKGNVDIDKLQKELEELPNISDDDLLQARELAEQRKADPNAESSADVVRSRIEALKKERLAAIDANNATVRTKQDFYNFLQRSVGSKDLRTYAKRMALAADDGSLEETFHHVRKLSESSLFERVTNAGLQVFQANLLSGIPTVVLNSIGPATARIVKRLELVSGSAYGAFIQNDPEMKAVMKAGLSLHSDMVTGIGSFQMFMKGFKTSGDPVTGGRNPFDDFAQRGGSLSPENLGINPEGMMGQMFSFMNQVTMLPFRMNAGIDAVNKNSAAYSSLHKQYMIDAIKKGIPEDQVEQYVRDNVMQTFTKSGALYSESTVMKDIATQARKEGFDPNDDLGVARRTAQLVKERKSEFDVLKQIKADKAATEARQVTMTEAPSGFITNTLNNLKRVFPPAGFAIPFVNTPMQILAFGLKRTLPVTIYTELAPKLTNKAAARRAEIAGMSAMDRAAYKGQVATGVFTSSALMYFAYLNKDKITGSGPRNPEELKALRSTGWQPNSFIFNNDEGQQTYVSYGRLDPIATVIGMAADLAEAMDGRYIKDEDGLEAFSTLAFGLAESVTDKSFLRGLNNGLRAISEPDTYGSKFFKDIAAGMTVPMFVDKMKNTEENILIRESRTVFDAIFRKLPVAEEMVPPKRTFLGDAVYRQNPLGYLGVANPIFVSSRNNDIVDKTIMELVHGFRMPSPKFNSHPDTDMRDFSNDKGFAYDRFLELSSTITIHGRTLRQALKGLITSRNYKQLNEKMIADGGVIARADGDPRVSLIKDVISMYRIKAKRETFSEFPTLMEAVRQIEEQKRQNNVTTSQRNPIPSL